MDFRNYWWVLLLLIVIVSSVLLLFYPKWNISNQETNLVGQAHNYYQVNGGSMPIFFGLMLLLGAILLFYFQPKSKYQERT